MKTDEMVKLLMDMMKNKKQLMKILDKDLAEARKYAAGCERVLDEWDGYESPENQRQQLKTAIKCNQKLMEVNCRLLLISLVTIGGDGFDASVAKMLVNLGHGDEAVRQMYQNKMKGG